MTSGHPEEAATKPNHTRVYTRDGLDWSLKVNPRSGTWRGSLDRGAATSERQKDEEWRHAHIYWELLWGSEEGQGARTRGEGRAARGKQETSGFLRRRGAHGRQGKPTRSGSTEFAVEEGKRHGGPPMRQKAVQSGGLRGQERAQGLTITLPWKLRSGKVRRKTGQPLTSRVPNGQERIPPSPPEGQESPRPEWLSEDWGRDVEDLGGTRNTYTSQLFLPSQPVLQSAGS